MTATAANQVSSKKVHLIEPQAIFVPMLSELFQELGLEVTMVTPGAEYQSLVDGQPRVLFIDADFMEQETVNLITLVRNLAPDSLIAIYTRADNAGKAAAYRAAGANAIVSKSSDREEIIAGLHQMLHTGEYTDVRFSETTT
ncbi:MAG TPA: hypothetical protein VIG51_02595 [Candidatus Baltobacteraceae bacterium]|jgi:CheY-like chemotaxis protein